MLAEFSDPGTVTFPAFTVTSTLLGTHGGNSVETQVTYAYLTGSVVYTYTPVPEPAALAAWSLLGAVGIALFWFRRNRWA